MVDVFRQNIIDSQRNKDPFQRAAEAANRNTQKIQAVVMPETVDFSHTTHDQAILGGKTYGDRIQDTAVSVGKGIVGVPQAIVGAADLVDYGVSSALKGYQEIGAVLDLIQEEANVIAATNSALISYAEQFGNAPVSVSPQAEIVPVTPSEPEVTENVLTNSTNQNEDGDIQSQAKPLTQETSNESGQAETNTRATNPVRRQSAESKERENDSNKRDGERTNREDKDSQDTRGSNGSNQASSRNIKSITPVPYEGSVSIDKEGKTITWFHGTKDDFTEFDLNHPNHKDHGWLGTGVYLTDSEGVATEYSNRKKGEGKPRVLKLNVDESKLLKLTMEDRNLIAK
ncbi:MAG: DUF3990 domain-containing protein [Gammaproteobacteria bacterium]|nr:DUF3990 domain-containing protein [Gammaproteobacteria bacterium]